MQAELRRAAEVHTQALAEAQQQARQDRAQVVEELQREAAVAAAAAREAGHSQAVLDLEPRMGEVGHKVVMTEGRISYA
jgi:hypothetical protein